MILRKLACPVLMFSLALISSEPEAGITIVADLDSNATNGPDTLMVEEGDTVLVRLWITGSKDSLASFGITIGDTSTTLNWLAESASAIYVTPATWANIAVSEDSLGFLLLQSADFSLSNPLFLPSEVARLRFVAEEVGSCCEISWDSTNCGWQNWELEDDGFVNFERAIICVDTTQEGGRDGGGYGDEELRTVYQEIEIPWPSEANRTLLAGLPELDVLGFSEGISIRILATPEFTEKLSKAGFKVDVLVEDYADHYYGERSAASLFVDGLFTYSEAVAYLDSMHTAYPSITTSKDSIGTSWQGRTVWAIKISDNPDEDESEPEILFDALHHAREPITVSVVLDLLRHLCENYGKDPEATFLVDEREIWIVPIVNPDGYILNEEVCADGMWRKNTRGYGPDSACSDCFGVDLNRNYGFQWSSLPSNPCAIIYPGPSAFSEPETQAIRDFIQSRDFVAYDSYHSNATRIYYPWAYTSTPSVDDTLFAAIAGERNRDNNYPYFPAGEGGPPFYGGTTIDWAYNDGVLSFATEAGGSSFWPDESEIPGLVADNLYSNTFLCLAAGSYVVVTNAAVSGGNGNDRFDPGETADLVVTIRNWGIADGASNVVATLASDDSYVQLDDASTSYGTIPMRAVADNSGDAFSLSVDSDCPAGHDVYVRVTINWDSGLETTEYLKLTVGSPTVIVSDDFEGGNNGWSEDPSHTATAGDWAIIDPNATEFQLEDDATPSPGTDAWITAQNTSLDIDDVDDGISALRSPTWDLSSYNSVRLVMNYFHGQQGLGGDSQDFFRVDLSNNGGTTFPATLDSIGDIFHEPVWTSLEVDLADHLSLSNQMAIRIQASDGTSRIDIVEAGIDDLVLLDMGSGNQAPGPPTLLSPDDGDYVLSTPLLEVNNAIDPEADTLTYGFRVYSDKLLTTLVRSVDGIAEGDSSTEWTVSPFLSEGSYWWRAYAEDDEKQGAYMPASRIRVVLPTDLDANNEAPSFTFHPARPNPTTKGTSIHFSLPEAGRVQADVFDLSGRRVRSLYRGWFSAGFQILTWDGKDQRGKSVGAGTYFIRLRTENQERVNRVTLVR